MHGNADDNGYVIVEHRESGTRRLAYQRRMRHSLLKSDGTGWTRLERRYKSFRVLRRASEAELEGVDRCPHERKAGAA